MTLDKIVSKNAVRYPSKLAISMGEISYTWATFETRVAKLAHAFHSGGLIAGDRLSVLADNCVEYLEIYFAASRAGVIVVPVNFRLTNDDLSSILNHACPSLLIFSHNYAESVRIIKDRVLSIKMFWQIGKSDESEFERYEEKLTKELIGVLDYKIDDNACFAIFYTSGTTGLPKGAMVSHSNLEMNSYNQIIADAASSEDINLISSPLYHMGAVFMAVTYMMLGCSQYVLYKFSADEWLASMASSKATVALLIPTMINSIVTNQNLNENTLSDLRLIFYGGGPMPPTVLRKAIDFLKCDFTQGYGLTETLEATFLLASDHVLDGDATVRKRLGSAGREAIGAELKIINENGKELMTGEVGEILIRSKSVISGYWDMPEETSRVISDGWFHTGDLGYLDDDRYLFVVDRKKDMVISGGVNIYTREIESRLYQHQDIIEAAVVGLPDENWGEIVTAIVVAKSGSQIDETEVVEFCGETLASFKKPKKVIFRDELPKNPSGKILKRDIRSSLTNLSS